MTDETDPGIVQGKSFQMAILLTRRQNMLLVRRLVCKSKPTSTAVRTVDLTTYCKAIWICTQARITVLRSWTILAPLAQE